MKQKLRELIKKYVKEITTTGDVDGYLTPYAFSSKNSKKKIKKISTNSTGYKIVKEELDSKDIQNIKKLIRDVVVDILRDIWLKRASWK